jgi:hypothetical protein
MRNNEAIIAIHAKAIEYFRAEMINLVLAESPAPILRNWIEAIDGVEQAMKFLTSKDNEDEDEDEDEDEEEDEEEDEDEDEEDDDGGLMLTFAVTQNSVELGAEFKKAAEWIKKLGSLSI